MSGEMRSTPGLASSTTGATHQNSVRVQNSECRLFSILAAASHWALRLDHLLDDMLHRDSRTTLASLMSGNLCTHLRLRFLSKLLCDSPPHTNDGYIPRGDRYFVQIFHRLTHIRSQRG
jgi:hypothetical protein